MDDAKQGKPIYRVIRVEDLEQRNKLQKQLDEVEKQIEFLNGDAQVELSFSHTNVLAGIGLNYPPHARVDDRLRTHIVSGLNERRLSIRSAMLDLEHQTTFD
ncbi:MAG: hypothetical protein ACX94C_11660 [Phycisphaerales bacterium]